jgi:hypothetical protein
MNSFAAGLVTGLVLAFFAFIARHREFRREERLKIYGDFIEAFSDAVGVGVGLMSVYMTFGDKMLVEPRYEDAIKGWGAVANRYQNTYARLRLIASDSARRAADELSDFMQNNIFTVPPFTMVIESKDMALWGDAAKQGPRAVQKEGDRLARQLPTERRAI